MVMAFNGVDIVNPRAATRLLFRAAKTLCLLEARAPRRGQPGAVVVRARRVENERTNEQRVGDGGGGSDDMIL